MRNLTRRHLMQGLVALAAAPAVVVRANPRQQPRGTGTGDIGPYRPETLPPGVRSRFVDSVNGLRMHVLEAGFEVRTRPAILLLHGYPELAYSWRNVIPRLAAGGYHVIAPDLRGYGRTSGTDVKYDDDLAPFRTLNEVRDIVGLVFAFGYRSVAAVVGHDFGSPVAAWCSVVRPDVFRSTVLMSAPFAGPPRCRSTPPMRRPAALRPARAPTRCTTTSRS